jgi:hypothetical protein
MNLMAPVIVPPATEERSVVDLNALRGRPLIGVEEAGAILGRGRSAAYEDAKRGDIPIVPLGGRLYVPVPELLRLLGFSDSTVQAVFFSPEGGDAPALHTADAVAASVA